LAGPDSEKAAADAAAAVAAEAAMAAAIVADAVDPGRAVQLDSIKTRVET